MARMMGCPRCGAANSVKRQACYACEAPLHEPEGALGAVRADSRAARPPQPPAPGTCAMCAHAVVFPPAGVKISLEEVYCAKREEPVAGATAERDCYEQAFSWRRADILD